MTAGGGGQDGPMVDPSAAVREPKQARSRESWERVLEVGRELIEEGGLGALTITEVCRRSGVSPPSLYARVDGKAGLFAAVYDRGMAEVQATEDLLFAGLPGRDASIEQQAADAAGAIARVFERHARFLRPVISTAESDPVLLARGAAESRRLLTRVAAAMDIDADVGEEVARTLYAECVLRTIYGATFFSSDPESDAAFRARLARTATARAAGAAILR
jgi:AcrR family transcriptional regulator